MMTITITIIVPAAGTAMVMISMTSISKYCVGKEIHLDVDVDMDVDLDKDIDMNISTDIHKPKHTW